MPSLRQNKQRDGVIWLLDQGGIPHTEIGAVFGISRSRVGSIVQSMDRRLEFRLGMWTAPFGSAPGEPKVPGQLVPQRPESRRDARARIRKVVLWSYLRPRCGICGGTAVHRVQEHDRHFFYDGDKSKDGSKVPCPPLLCNDCYMKSARWTGIKVMLIQLDDAGLEVTS